MSHFEDENDYDSSPPPKLTPLELRRKLRNAKFNSPMTWNNSVSDSTASATSETSESATSTSSASATSEELQQVSRSDEWQEVDRMKVKKIKKQKWLERRAEDMEDFLDEVIEGDYLSSHDE